MQSRAIICRARQHLIKELAAVSFEAQNATDVHGNIVIHCATSGQSGHAAVPTRVVNSVRGRVGGAVKRHAMPS